MGTESGSEYKITEICDSKGTDSSSGKNEKSQYQSPEGISGTGMGILWRLSASKNMVFSQLRSRKLYNLVPERTM